MAQMPYRWAGVKRLTLLEPCHVVLQSFDVVLESFDVVLKSFESKTALKGRGFSRAANAFLKKGFSPRGERSAPRQFQIRTKNDRR
jgi:hypothetical protein